MALSPVELVGSSRVIGEVAVEVNKLIAYLWDSIFCDQLREFHNGIRAAHAMLSACKWRTCNIVLCCVEIRQILHSFAWDCLLCNPEFLEFLFFEILMKI